MTACWYRPKMSWGVDGEAAMKNDSSCEWPGTYMSFVQEMRESGVPSGSVPPRQVVESTSLEYPESLPLSFSRGVLFGTLGFVSMGFLYGTSKGVSISGIDVLERHLPGSRKIFASREDMKEKPPVITVSNHVSVLDEPVMMSVLSGPGRLLRPSTMRWTLCAQEITHVNDAFASFFGLAKGLPILRGASLYQVGMKVFADKLFLKNSWLHIFPEGRCWEPPKYKIGGDHPHLRRGVGALVAAAETTPVIIPVVHRGMEKVKPRDERGKSGALRFPERITIKVGEPVDVSDLLAAHPDRYRNVKGAEGYEGWAQPRAARDLELYNAITKRIEVALRKLEKEIDEEERE